MVNGWGAGRGGMKSGLPVMTLEEMMLSLGGDRPLPRPRGGEAHPLGRWLRYDKRVLEELRRVYGSSLNTLLASLVRPPTRYYVRVNTLRVDPSDLLDSLRSRGVEVFFDEFLGEALWFPVKGPFRVRDTGCYIVVDKRAGESIMLGANVYAPGVLHADCRAGVEATVVTEEGVAVANAVVEEGFQERLREGRGLVAVNVRPAYRLPSLRDTGMYAQGLIYEQSLPSMYVARILSPRKNTVIVDMCAAPGGKTSHVYELVKGQATIIAIDHSKRRLERMRRELARLGHHGVKLVRADARYVDLRLGKNIADYVILDPPCSSLGVTPKLQDRKTGRDIENAARYQRQFLRAAYWLLKPGGTLVYSTCTITLAENEHNIEYAIEHLGFEPEDISYWRRWSKGVGSLAATLIRSHPNVHGTPGYFIAKLRKKN